MGLAQLLLRTTTLNRIENGGCYLSIWLSLYVPFPAGPLDRSFAKPPKQVQVVCECILVMRGYKEISWQSAKGMMSDPNFLRSLMEMDCDSINNNQVRTVKGKLACKIANKNAHLY